MTATKPERRPACANFSSGPCAKRPGYSLDALAGAALGRSHRSAVGKEKIAKALGDTKRILGIPEDYLVGMVPASDTGAIEMAMWSMLGPRPVDLCCWESFGKGWHTDCTQQLPLTEEKGGKGVNLISADYGDLPDLSKADPAHDIIFTLNGTTSGVRVPNLDWISSSREGLTFCDATSGIFSMPVDWSKIDVLTFSWQKVLGGEAAHGILVLSPRAVERLESYQPSWPLPKIFRMTKKGKVDRSIFTDSPINTVSLLCIEDYLDALAWVDSVGGLDGLIDLSRQNLAVMEAFVESTPWLDFLAKDPECRSTTSVCFAVTDLEGAQVKQMTKMLASEGVAYDINSYKDAPAGLRLWCGATVSKDDLEAVTHWLAWAHDQVKNTETK